MRAARFVVATVLVGCAAAAGLSACESPLPPNAPPIAHTWLGKCGACHNRVEPGTHTRAQLTDAFTRHRKRVSLTEDEWAQMIDYLAIAPSPPEASPSSKPESPSPAP